MRTLADRPEAILRTQELIATIVRAIIDDEESARVEINTHAHETVLRLYVSSADIGKVIGKQGRTARALRTILGELGLTQGVRFSLDIVSPREVPATLNRGYELEATGRPLPNPSSPALPEVLRF